MTRLSDHGSLELEGEVITSRQFLPEFYKQRDYQLAWSSHMDNARALADRILASHQEGLVPADYHAAGIQHLLAASSDSKLSDAQRVDLDIMLSEALARYAYHLRFGKVNPERLDADWNIQRSFKGQDPLVELQGVIDSKAFDAQLDARISQLPVYPQLRDALAKYVAIGAAGGWPAIPAGPTLKPGMQDERVLLVRQRLRVTDDLSVEAAVDDPLEFDAALQEAVVHFQLRHGLDTDGFIGKGTLAAMNVPVAARINQIRVNLDRARWVSQDIPETFVIVDIAGFNARLFRDGVVVWDEPAQVGKPYRSTPVFREDMTYLEINPTWTIPPTILAKDILPKVKKDPAYLQKKHMQVLTRDGKVVDPKSIDWSSMSARGFPYILRQTPGPHNALGGSSLCSPIRTSSTCMTRRTRNCSVAAAVPSVPAAFASTIPIALPNSCCRMKTTGIEKRLPRRLTPSSSSASPCLGRCRYCFYTGRSTSAPMARSISGTISISVTQKCWPVWTGSLNLMRRLIRLTG